MGTFSVISEDAFSQLQLDAGVLLNTFDPTNPAAPASSAIICATTGGITVSCIPTFSDLAEDVDNAPNGVLEFKHVDSWECTMSTTCLNVTPEAIRLALGVADVGTTDATKVTPRKDINTTTDFSDIWWVGDKADGGFVAVKLMNAMSTGGFSLQTTKNGKGQLSITLSGHVSLATQDVVPMLFYSTEG